MKTIQGRNTCNARHQEILRLPREVINGGRGGQQRTEGESTEELVVVAEHIPQLEGTDLITVCYNFTVNHLAEILLIRYSRIRGTWHIFQEEVGTRINDHLVPIQTWIGTAIERTH